MTEMIWHHAVTSEQLQEGLNFLLSTLRKRATVLLMIDARHLSASRAVDQSWIKNIFMPELNGANLERFARITDPNSLSEAITTSIAGATHSQQQPYSFLVENFSERDEAIEWLLDNISV